MYWVEMETGEIINLPLKREKFLEHFANRAPCLIGMEAGAGSQHWARQLQALGHKVTLLPGKRVKPFVGGNKNDAADARAIWTAVQQPGIKSVAVKSEAQQAVLALHRMRSQLVKFRTAQINGLRGLLTEYGEVMPQGKTGVRKGVSKVLQCLADRLPAVLIDTLREQFERIGKLEAQVAEIEGRLRQWHKDDPASQRIAAIPGVGLLTATAAVAT
ncbi:MAG: IS110 family transposase, partial [Gammaproteobacteria bacterium]